MERGSQSGLYYTTQDENMRGDFADLPDCRPTMVDFIKALYRENTTTRLVCYMFK